MQQLQLKLKLQLQLQLVLLYEGSSLWLAYIRSGLITATVSDPSTNLLPDAPISVDEVFCKPIGL